MAPRIARLPGHDQQRARRQQQRAARTPLAPELHHRRARQRERHNRACSGTASIASVSHALAGMHAVAMDAAFAFPYKLPSALCRLRRGRLAASTTALFCPGNSEISWADHVRS